MTTDKITDPEVNIAVFTIEFRNWVSFNMLIKFSSPMNVGAVSPFHSVKANQNEDNAGRIWNINNIANAGKIRIYPHKASFFRSLNIYPVLEDFFSELNAAPT